MPTLIDTSYVIDIPSVLLLAAIYAVAAVFSGLSGFGFSAIGALSLVMLPPQLGVPVLMALSVASQAPSYGSLARELRQHAGAWHRRDGVMPYMAGGVVGLPVGLAILSLLDARPLIACLGTLLVAYAAWSLHAPAHAVMAVPASSIRSAMLVGAVGGVVGSFAAFPGSALVIWNGIVGRTKEQSRALTQPYILCMQLAALLLLAPLHPKLFDISFWTLLAVALPGTLVGYQFGVTVYRRTGGPGYRRITLIMLGLAGAGLLLNLALG
ncbi:MAG: sulfite exporter TauE/SafE family protein [Chitinophagaceae bacterium]|nr:sulfite exporter TauE/SafE family protein [Rubrivivax sp.]